MIAIFKWVAYNFAVELETVLERKSSELSQLTGPWMWSALISSAEPICVNTDLSCHVGACGFHGRIDSITLITVTLHILIPSTNFGYRTQFRPPVKILKSHTTSSISPKTCVVTSLLDPFVSNACRSFSGVACGSKLIPALYEKAQAPE